MWVPRRETHTFAAAGPDPRDDAFPSQGVPLAGGARPAMARVATRGAEPMPRRGRPPAIGNWVRAEGIAGSLYELHLRAHTLPQDSFRHWLASHVAARIGAVSAWVVDRARAEASAAEHLARVSDRLDGATDELVVLPDLIAVGLPEPETQAPSTSWLLLVGPPRGFDGNAARHVALVRPHLGLALALNRWEQQVRANGPTSRVGRAHAVTDARGRIVQADPEFVPLLRREWPPEASTLPAVLHVAMGNAPARRVGELLTLDCVPVGPATWLWVVRPREQVDALSERQQSVARLYVEGRNYREIAAALGLAPATVRRHLQSIYERLGVRRKLELVRLLGDLPAAPRD